MGSTDRYSQDVQDLVQKDTTCVNPLKGKVAPRRIRLWNRHTIPDTTAAPDKTLSKKH